MKILLIGFGSRGDVQPLLPLAHGLLNAGYEVAIAAGSNFRQMVEDAGIAYAPLRTDMQALMNSDAGKEWVENSSANPLKEAQNMKAMIGEVRDVVIEDLINVTQDADVLVSGLPSFSITDAIAQKHGKKHITILFAPLKPTREAAATIAPIIPKAKNLLNRLSGTIGQYFTYWIFKDVTNEFRRGYGLEPIKFGDYARRYNRDVPVIYGLSEHVLPRPSDWGEHLYVTGYWFADQADDWQAPQALRDFLDAGAPPVYIGFGSMATKDPEATAKIMIDALKASGQRGVIHSGWAGLNSENVPHDIYLLDFAPHDWLFPRMAGVIHHGGAGTTAAALRAGVPSSVVSHMADQPYWGRRVEELGVGGKLIKRHQLSAERLAEVIRQITGSSTMKAKAVQLGEKIRAEDGVAQAVKVFQQILG